MRAELVRLARRLLGHPTWNATACMTRCGRARLVRRRRVGARGCRELVSGNVLIGEGDDPRSETVGACYELPRRIAGTKVNSLGVDVVRLPLLTAATVPAAEALVSRGFTRIKPEVLRDTDVGIRNRTRKWTR